jgi:hypothetical protein
VEWRGFPDKEERRIKRAQVLIHRFSLLDDRGEHRWISEVVTEFVASHEPHVADTTATCDSARVEFQTRQSHLVQRSNDRRLRALAALGKECRCTNSALEDPSLMPLQCDKGIFDYSVTLIAEPMVPPTRRFQPHRAC